MLNNSIFAVSLISFIFLQGIIEPSFDFKNISIISVMGFFIYDYREKNRRLENKIYELLEKLIKENEAKTKSM